MPQTTPAPSAPSARADVPPELTTSFIWPPLILWTHVPLLVRARVDASNVTGRRDGDEVCCGQWVACDDPRKVKGAVSVWRSTRTNSAIFRRLAAKQAVVHQRGEEIQNVWMGVRE